MKKYFVLITAVIIAQLLGGCKKVPQAELDAASLALQQAKSAGADVYLVADYQALQDSLNVIKVSFETQKGRIFRNYKEPKQKLTDVSAKASELVNKTETRKTEIKNEVQSTQNSVMNIMAENNKLLAMAPRGKEGKQAIDAITSDLNMINASVNDVPVLLENGELLSAQTKINAAQQKAAEINTELKTVVEKYARKR